MKIKKNGKTINLTEADIRKLSKSLLNEGPDPPAPYPGATRVYKYSGVLSLEERVLVLEEEVSKLKSIMNPIEDEDDEVDDLRY